MLFEDIQGLVVIIHLYCSSVYWFIWSGRCKLKNTLFQIVACGHILIIFIFFLLEDHRSISSAAKHQLFGFSHLYSGLEY